MATISLCMIVKNESAVLARCLDSIADLMDEIIIVDTGSTERNCRTVHLADLRFQMDQRLFRRTQFFLFQSNDGIYLHRRRR